MSGRVECLCVLNDPKWLPVVSSLLAVDSKSIDGYWSRPRVDSKWVHVDSNRLDVSRLLLLEHSNRTRSHRLFLRADLLARHEQSPCLRVDARYTKADTLDSRADSNVLTVDSNRRGSNRVDTPSDSNDTLGLRARIHADFVNIE